MPSGPAIIQGIVRDASGAPVAGARVMFVDGPGALPDIAALTGEGGEFTLSAPVAGTYRIHCDAEGQGTADVDVAIAAGGRRRVEVTIA